MKRKNFNHKVAEVEEVKKVGERRGGVGER
jgi:hypothetical protein